jgi:hypothetical protein
MDASRVKNQQLHNSNQFNDNYFPLQNHRKQFVETVSLKKEKNVTADGKKIVRKAVVFL